MSQLAIPERDGYASCRTTDTALASAHVAIGSFVASGGHDDVQAILARPK
jgi:hypothetical protein